VRRLAQLAVLSALLALAPASAAWGSYRIGISVARAIRPGWLARGAAVGRARSRPRGADSSPPGVSQAAFNAGPTPSPMPSPTPSPTPTPSPPLPACTTTVSSPAALSTEVGGADPGAVICLADGSYGALSLDAEKTGEVLIRARNPGAAHIAGADLDGSHLTLSRFDVNGLVDVMPGSDHMTISYNRISGGEHGVQAAPTTDVDVSDVSIVGNRFVGPFGEDAIRLNRYHDANGDGVGALIAGNEFTNIRENGSHSDCLQTVWVGDHLVFRDNYLHDNRCQGFFVKDQASTVVGLKIEDNLFLRNDAPCDPPDSGCGQPADLQVFGPYAGLTMRHNTIWGNGAIAAFQNGAGPRSTIAENVIFKFWTSTDLSALTYRDNTRCQRQASPGGAWPAASPGEVTDCNPAFAAPKRDDYRLANGRGVTWAPAKRHFGF
jgi:hypothetical protein